MKLFSKSIGTGKKIVIVHGLFGSSDNWVTFAKMLADAGNEVILTDLRNHGRSPHSSSMTYSEMAEDLKELYDDEGLIGSMIIGHSMGGKAAMKFAFKYPDYIEKMIVVDIAPRAYPLHHDYILEALNGVDFSIATTRGKADEIVSKGIPDAETRQFLLKNLYWQEGHKLAWRFNLPVLTRDIGQVGEAVYPDNTFNKSTLFIKGEKSNYITYDDEREIFEFFTDVEIKTIPQAGHWVHAENPNALLEEVLKFSSK